MKELKIKRGAIKLIALILSSVILLFLLFWLGFSFFSMRSDNPYLGMFVDFKGDSLAEKVKNDFPTRDGKYLEYSFLITLEQFSETEEGYKITGVPYSYNYYYDTRDEARFEYFLDKDKGKFDFSQVEWNDSLVVKLKYRLDQDFAYFWEFSLCTIKKTYSNLFNLDNPCARGNCFVAREVNQWSIETQNKDLVEKAEFISNYDKDSLVRGLLNFYITDDFAYFDDSMFKKQAFQISKPDGSFQFDNNFVKENTASNSNLSIYWLISGLSEIFNKKYTEYEEIDMLSYMRNILSYTKEEISETFLNCKVSYEIVSNLKDCKEEVCQEIKESAFDYCKRSIESEIASYANEYDDFQGYHREASDSIFLFYLPSEMIYYNTMINEMGLSEKEYEEQTIDKYYVKAATLNDKSPSVVGQCILLKDIENMNNAFSNQTYANKKEILLSGLPDFNTLCQNYKKDVYCSLGAAERLICADALTTSRPEIGREILLDIFYSSYFESPASIKIQAYEALRNSPNFNVSRNGLVKLDEYGYFVSRVETESVEGITVLNIANMLDSYYFINIFNKLGDE